MAAPILPRIDLDDLEEFVEDTSPASGGLSWEDSAQTIVYDVPFSYLYDALLLLIGYAYTQDVACKANNDPTNPIPAPATPVPTFTAACSTNSNWLDSVSDMSKVFVNAKIYRTSTGALVGTVVGLNGNDNNDQLFRAVQLDNPPTFNSFSAAPETFNVGTDLTEKRKFLRRLLPAAHPIFPYMSCTRIDNWQGISPKGKGTSLSRLPLTTIIKNVQKYTSLYSVLRITATFTMPKYKLAKDPPYGNESCRYLWREQSPSASMITLDKGTMVYAEGSGGGFIPTIGRTFTAPGYGQPEIKQNFAYYWSHIPEDYFNTVATYSPPQGDDITEIGLPIRFVQALQCVNKTNFFGFKPGTLLMEPYEYERFRMPLEFTDAVPRFWVRLKINMQYFNPKYIANGTNPRVKFGHLTAPVGMQGYAYFQTANTDPPLDRYESYDFNSLFYPLTAAERTTVV